MFQDKKSNLPLLFGFFALIFCLIVPIYFMNGVPDAFSGIGIRYEPGEDDISDRQHPSTNFFGSYEDKTETSQYKETKVTSWGGDIGWFLAWISFAMVLISFILIIRKKKIVTNYQKEKEKKDERTHTIKNTQPSNIEWRVAIS